MCVHYNVRVKLLWAILLRQVWQLNFGKKKFLKRDWKKSQVESRESCLIMVWSLLLTIDIFFISSSKSHKSTRKFILCWKIHTSQIKTSNCKSNLLFIPHKYCTKTITAVNLSITLISDPKLRELIWCAMSGLSGCERHNRNHLIKFASGTMLFSLIEERACCVQVNKDLRRITNENQSSHLCTCSMGGHVEITRNLEERKIPS